MKTLYIECKMGAAGDMLMAALYELLTKDQKTIFLDTMNHIFGEDIRLEPESTCKCGISGTHMHVEILHDHNGTVSYTEEHTHHTHCAPTHEHTHAHYTYSSILQQIHALSLPEEVKAHAANVYRMIGEAEAKVHNSTLEQIHFHEVGSLDALADVVGTCLLLSYLAPSQMIVSPIHVGNGTVHCAHGILPVPAPATAEILKGVPCYTGEIASELCTPTGAALLKYFANDFGSMPMMTIEQIGLGFGTKDFPVVNAIRTFYGNTADEKQDMILDLSCNLDDMTGEALGYVMEQLFAAGALDVFYQPIQMKKNRPGILLHCFCKPEEKEQFTQLIFRHTTTRGIRFLSFERDKMDVQFVEHSTPYGIVREKVNTRGSIVKKKYEYEDLRAIADASQLSLNEVMDLLNSHPN